MKSKYRIYMLLILVAQIGFMGAMEEVIEISKEGKQEWQEICIRSVLLELLQPEYNKSRNIFDFTPLSFEVVGSQKFIAYKLGKRLDSSDVQDNYFKELVKKRNAVFTELKTCAQEDVEQILDNHFESIDARKLLPFIRSLEESIKKRIQKKNLTEEIAWRKEQYRWLSPKTGYCRNLEKCLALDIEEDFTLEDLRSGDYY